MSIKTKKIIRFVPIINFIIIGFLWLKLYISQAISKKRFLLNLLKIFGLCLIVTIPEILIDALFDIPLLETAINFATSYLYMLVFSSFAIYDEEKIIKESEK